MLVKSERLRFSEALDFGDAHFSMAQDPRFYSTNGIYMLFFSPIKLCDKSRIEQQKLSLIIFKHVYLRYAV